MYIFFICGWFSAFRRLFFLVDYVEFNFFIIKFRIPKIPPSNQKLNLIFIESFFFSPERGPSGCQIRTHSVRKPTPGQPTKGTRLYLEKHSGP